MGQPYATSQDVQAVFRPLTEAESTRVDALLTHASAMLRGRFPNLDARIAAGTLDPGQPQIAAVNMVLRVMRNPGGLRQETVGPVSRTFETTQSAGLLEITAAETALLGAGSSRGGVRTINVGTPPGWAGDHVRGW